MRKDIQGASLTVNGAACHIEKVVI